MEKESLDMFLAELGKEPPPTAPEAAGSGSNEDAAGLGIALEGDRRTDAKVPDGSSAARNKACRERAVCHWKLLRISACATIAELFASARGRLS